MITNKNRYRRQVVKTGTVVNIGPTAARYLIIVLIAVFSLLYLVQSTQGATKIVELRGVEKKRDELTKEISTLEINVGRLKSIQKLNETATSTGLVPVPNETETVTLPAQP